MTHSRSCRWHRICWSPKLGLEVNNAGLTQAVTPWNIRLGGSKRINKEIQLGDRVEVTALGV
jgi:hypothetical protein